MLSLLLLLNLLKCSNDFLLYIGYTKLVVIGGYNGNDLSRVEVFDLLDASKNCSQISDYPTGKYEMTVGVMQGVIKSCGGWTSPNDVCYDYHPESNTWVNSASMIQDRWFHQASFIQDVWLISGGGSAQSLATTEM